VKRSCELRVGALGRLDRDLGDGNFCFRLNPLEKLSLKLRSLPQNQYLPFPHQNDQNGVRYHCRGLDGSTVMWRGYRSLSTHRSSLKRVSPRSIDSPSHAPSQYGIQKQHTDLSHRELCSSTPRTMMFGTDFGSEFTLYHQYQK